jgi:hypothetical protein
MRLFCEYFVIKENEKLSFYEDKLKLRRFKCKLKVENVIKNSQKFN